MQAWAAHMLEPTANHATQLNRELTDDEALDLWMPLQQLTLPNGSMEQLESRGRALSFPAARQLLDVIIAWPDGVVHEGAPPRKRLDLIALYRAARIDAEFVWVAVRLSRQNEEVAANEGESHV
jgi:hypothetical protein